MAFAFVQNKSVGVNPGTSIAIAVTATGQGNLVVISFKILSTTIGITSITDNVGNTYQSSGTPEVSTASAVGQWWGYQTTGGATTITVNFSGSIAARAEADEFSGSASSNVVDVSAGAVGSTGSPSVLLSPSLAGELIVGTILPANTLTAGTGYTLTSTSSANLSVEYKLSGTTSETVSATQTSGGWNEFAAAYKFPSIGNMLEVF